MRMKKKCALLLAAAMMVGTVGLLGPEQTKADSPTNTYTLNVPADTNLRTAGWNGIGNVGVSGISMDTSLYYVSVDIEDGATNRTLTDATIGESIKYEIKVGTESTATAFGMGLDFTADGQKLLGAVVDETDFGNATPGIYTDTITFKATFGINYTMTGDSANSAKLKDKDMLKSSTNLFTSGGTQYIAYNGFIQYTSGASKDDAKKFVELLNQRKVDGHTDWMLLDSEQMARDWWPATDPTSETKGIRRFGTNKVSYIWTSYATSSNTYGFKTESAYYGKEGWEKIGYGYDNGTVDHTLFGFVVVRPYSD